MLSWFYIKSESLLPLEHMNYTQNLLKAREADAQVDAEVLAGRMELSRNFDALNEQMQRYRDSFIQLQSLPDFLPETDKKQVAIQLDQLDQSWQKKSYLIDQIKRNYSVLRNSISLYQKLTSEKLAQFGVQEVRSQLESLVRDILFFMRQYDLKILSRIKATKQNLEALKSELRTPAEKKELESLLLHTQVIIDYQPKVDQNIRQSMQLQLSTLFDKIFKRYYIGYVTARDHAQVYRYLLYIGSILLTIYLAFTFIRLEQTRQSLSVANKQIIRRYRAQKKAEKNLLLHDTAFNNTHEAITITDELGTIIEVNPAFSRITGYEKGEVLGRNPRVLKSGLHDSEFYHNMWKNITLNGNWRGEIWNRNKYGEIYPEILSITAIRNSKNKIKNFVAVFSDISYLKEHEKKLHKMAHYDGLTNLPNRVLLIDRLKQAQSMIKRSNKLLAICFLDLDGFKLVNDTFGHDVGDALLVEMSNRIQSRLRASDTVARIGGDEFVILLTGLDKIEECFLFLQRLMQEIAVPYPVVNESITLSTSIGITLYPKDDADAETLIRHADQAMYQAKSDGKNAYCLFGPEMDTEQSSLNERIKRIKQAIENDEMVIHYQPKVDLRAARVIGAEALIRWQHPDQGLIMPNDFLPLIEDLEVSLTLGRWTIRRVLWQMQQWKNQGIDLSVSINVSSLQIQHFDFVEELKSLLEQFPDIQPSRLELEILETAALEDIVNISRVIHECRRIGVNFSLDDFGTGYSSLTYLKRLPANTLKIDLSFVRDMHQDPENLIIIDAIMGLASAFQLNVIAEGVEEVVHGRMLLQMGCSQIQGYAISHPLGAQDFIDWLKTWQLPEQWSSIQHLQWDEKDFQMLYAEVELQRYVALTSYSVKQQKPFPFIDSGKTTSCSFGTWYHGSGKKHYEHLMPVYQQIGEAHEQLHQLAAQSEALMIEGNSDEANHSLNELLEVRDKILALMLQLTIRVAHVD
jgi:diguanylate cyclase (GGDEF)-like protein/PAS domain S-box-containing protein